MNHVQRVLTAFVLSFTVVTGQAAVFEVSSAKQIKQAMKKLAPGDELVLRNGKWKHQQIRLKASGTADKPITVRAETAGKVALTGQSFLYVEGHHINVSGLLFYDGSLNKGHVIRISGQHNSLRDTAIVNYNPKSINTRYQWLSVYGSHHTITNNHFEGQSHSGVTLVVGLKKAGDGHHTISHNYFGKRPAGNANGFETIRIGTGKSAHLSANTIVEHNLFEQCNGEIEIISNKTKDNIYRFNTFKESAGTLTVRQGMRVGIGYNHFIGHQVKGTGGVRVIGNDHLVFGNVFESLAGRADGVLSLTAGTVLEPGKTLTLYPQVTGAVLANNLLVDNAGAYVALEAGLGSKERKLLPENVMLINNQFIQQDSSAPLIAGTRNSKIYWQGNQANAVAISNLSEDQAVTGVVLDNDLNPSAGHNFMANLVANHHCKKTVETLDEARWDLAQLAKICEQFEPASLADLQPKTTTDVGVSWVN
ncbi:polysaccharide lyase 6 family protein [Neiella marina]|uniref:Polysaccharide lyase 6 family protein n=1 Tax=Neiella holothuriorum TaxID=2870530 RepID=A0ABS7EJE9_9GAMM|nr:polysaccharide lyase 6 family protein [Neiella holothuriorum]MBW8192466.1 polysaccharide lyase 6 family protein [Neiella holothuriorum]